MSLWNQLERLKQHLLQQLVLTPSLPKAASKLCLLLDMVDMLDASINDPSHAAAFMAKVREHADYCCDPAFRSELDACASKAVYEQMGSQPVSTSFDLIHCIDWTHCDVN
jgi:hypothetical protein